MKKSFLLAFTMLIALILVACSDSEETSNSNEENTQQTNKVSNTEGTENKSSEVVEETKEADIIQVSSDSEKTSNEVQQAENLLDKDKVFEFEYGEGTGVLTLETVEFTKKFGASNADPNDTWENHEITTDSEIYLHLTGTIKNDTTKSISFGNALGFIDFDLLYDGKHAFEDTSTAEEENGTKLGASSVDALTEGNIHAYFQVPKPVSETEQPLVLTVTIGEKTFEIELR